MDNTHENEQLDTQPEEKADGYVPRPVWQVWGARVALVIFLGLVALQILQIARGGL